MLLSTAMLRAQPRYTIQFGGGGLGLQWLSLMFEVNAHSFSDSSIVQSMRFATGYGIPMLNATYLPVEMRLVGFQGSHHLEAVAGCNIQVAWTEGADDGWRDVGSSPLNPTAALVYRFEPEEGGFFLRFGIGIVYIVTDKFLLPCGTGGIGIAF